ncbi:unnamed protein product [Rotaria magnacalcarata]|uniref:RNA helicase n=1 Tax=Rotaria magnacalcarata TaxID=392030 RepID=A0A816A0A4_9BILA|nr:unnamed protein product [Rotaria magnacalcarata]
MLDEAEIANYHEIDDAQETKTKNETSLQHGTIRGSNVSSSFNDFLFKPELVRFVMDFGFEHPSEVQRQSIPQAILGTDIVCQAKSGMGKTTVFILATLQQLKPVDGQVSVLVLCHTSNLAFSIRHEYERFCKYIVLEPLDMRRDIHEIFKMTPQEKQVLMFSALNKQIRPVCKEFMRYPMEIYIDDESKLTPHIGRADHFGTKGLALTFISDESDATILNEVQRRVEMHFTESPYNIDAATYMEKR